MLNIKVTYIFVTTAYICSPPLSSPLHSLQQDILSLKRVCQEIGDNYSDNSGHHRHLIIVSVIERCPLHKVSSQIG